MAQSNYISQTANYGGQLVFPVTTVLPTVTIPLYIRQADIPIRQPKITEISTLPTPDESGYSDGTIEAAFFGGTEPLITQLAGYLLTPTTQVTDGVTGLKYLTISPTSNGVQGGPILGFPGLTYGDLIWAYLEGKANPIGTANFRRVDPSSYTDPFGNVYSPVAIKSFTSTQTVSIVQQNFTMTLVLEI